MDLAIVVVVMVFLTMSVEAIADAISSSKTGYCGKRLEGLEKKVEGLEYSSVDDENALKKELREIKEALKRLASQIKHLKISKSAEEAVPYYKNELLQEENDALKEELAKLRAAIGFGTKDADGAKERGQ